VASVLPTAAPLRCFWRALAYRKLLNEAHWKALETPFLADWKRSENTLKTPEIGRPPKIVDHWKDKKYIFISNN
jgi:hypothetical protein